MPTQRFPAPPSRARRRRMVTQLGGWFAREQRDLPWRRTSDPYAIWISEAMLQQTRVETVVDYWTRFLTRFPDLASLARAEVDEVLAQWSGLGYYRRARALHAAAGRLVEEHAGSFPRTREALEALPGVGPYTAGALLSIAFDQPEALVDGNVERVFARQLGLDAPADDPGFKRHTWELAQLFVREADSPGAWNQALMELGATVCTPRGPRCEVCPLARSCVARRAGRVDQFPGPKVRRAAIAVELEILVVREGRRLLLQRRPQQGRMAGLLELPTRERPAADRPGAPLSGLFPSAWATGAGGEELVRAIRPRVSLGEVRHAITRHRIRAEALAGEWCSDGPLDPRFSWVALADLEACALTGMARKVQRRISASRGNLAAPE